MNLKKKSFQFDISSYIKEVLKSKLQMSCFILFIAGVAILFLSSFLSFQPSLYLVMQSLGGVLVGSSIVSLVYEYFLRKNFIELLKSESTNILFEFQPIFEQLNELGIVAVYKNRDEIDWSVLFESCPNEIAILDTSISYWSSIADIGHIIEKNQNDGCLFRILVLDPDSQFSEERGRSVGYSEKEYFPNEIRGSVDLFKKYLNKQCLGTLEIRKYNSMPSCVVIIVGNRVFINPIIRSYRGRDCIHFELDKFSKGSQPFIDHFEKTWEIGKTYDAG